MPEDDSDTYGDIKGMFCTELWYLKAEVSRIHHVLTDSGHLISEYNGIFPTFFRNECIQHHGTDCLFRTYDRIPVFLKTVYCIHCVIDMFPCHAVFRSEG